MGIYPFGTYNRIDAVLTQAKSVSLRIAQEPVNGVDCYVIVAVTQHGDYMVWLDPEHGYNVAKIHLRMSRDKGHIQYASPMRMRDVSFTHTNLTFAEKDGVWVPMESRSVTESILPDGRCHISRRHVEVTDVRVNPDHDALLSFEPNDIRNGAQVWLVPHVQIRYSWLNGDLITRIDEDVVAHMNDTIQQMLMDQNLARNDLKAGTPAVAIGQDEQPAKTSARPHCGLYCLYSLLRFWGQDLDYRDLVKPEYLGSQRGSSFADLKRGAIDYGLYAEVGMRLNMRALRGCPYAAIVHVRRHARAREYDHYELFLGSEKGKAKLLNPPESPQLVTFHELAARWDGNALFLSERPFNVDAILGTNRKQLLLYAIVGVVGLGALYATKHVWASTVGAVPRRWSMGLAIGQCTLLCVAGGAVGMLYHFGKSDGLLANGAATAALQNAYWGTFIPRISGRSAQKLMRSDVVLIDARLAQDYERGHVDRAISIPVDANDAIWRERTALIPKDTRIIVYCQSARCRFAEDVSVRLMAAGFDGICIFRGGWNEWVARHPDAQKQASEDRGKQHDRT
jgi:rhodanese-related sulfurtransferase